eukprot:RCo054777
MPQDAEEISESIYPSIAEYFKRMTDHGHVPMQGLMQHKSWKLKPGTSAKVFVGQLNVAAKTYYGHNQVWKAYRDEAVGLDPYWKRDENRAQLTGPHLKQEEWDALLKLLTRDSVLKKDQGPLKPHWGTSVSSTRLVEYLNQGIKDKKGVSLPIFQKDDLYAIKYTQEVVDHWEGSETTLFDHLDVLARLPRRSPSPPPMMQVEEKSSPADGPKKIRSPSSTPHAHYGSYADALLNARTGSPTALVLTQTRATVESLPGSPDHSRLCSQSSTPRAHYDSYADALLGASSSGPLPTKQRGSSSPPVRTGRPTALVPTQAQATVGSLPGSPDHSRLCSQSSTPRAHYDSYADALLGASSSGPLPAKQRGSSSPPVRTGRPTALVPTQAQATVGSLPGSPD